jgi:hypothetical protein
LGSDDLVFLEENIWKPLRVQTGLNLGEDFLTYFFSLLCRKANARPEAKKKVPKRAEPAISSVIPGCKRDWRGDFVKRSAHQTKKAKNSA